MSFRRCSFPAATSAACRCTAPSTTSPWRARCRSICPAAFILEEGFPLADLARIVESMARAAREAGVPIVTGDTKVVERGKGDGVFITTTGIGVVPEGVNISGERARPGDAIIVSGPIGDHGVAILSLAREPQLRHRHPVRHRRAARAGGGDGRRGAGHPRAARPDARRAGHHPERNRPPVRRRHDAARNRPADPRRSPRGVRIPRPRSAVFRQRRQAGRDLPARGCRRLAGGHARPPAGHATRR